MIWTDDKIKRLMSMGMMHGGRDDDATSSAGGSDSGSNGGGDEGLGGLGEELSVDLGGGVSIGINSVTGDVTRSGVEELGEEGRKDFSDFLGRKEAELGAGQAVSDFGSFLSNLSAKQIGAGIGALGGTLLGIGPLAGAVAGARIGGLAGPKETGLTQTGPGGAPAQAQQAPGQPQQLAGVPSAGGLAGGGLPDSQFGGGESQPALQLAAAGRQSGIAAAPVQTQPQVNPFLSQRPQFQGLPQVNLGQFPNALGRV